jgi:ABC-type nickel/cobalt efflux system permease component RcnA
MNGEVPAPTMNETQSIHEPSPDEEAHGGSDHGLHHPGDLRDEAHGADDHGEGHGHDDHAHPSETLGPVDVQAWGALLVGIALGLAIVLGLVMTNTILP